MLGVNEEEEEKEKEAKEGGFDPTRTSAGSVRRKKTDSGEKRKKGGVER